MHKLVCLTNAHISNPSGELCKVGTIQGIFMFWLHTHSPLLTLFAISRKYVASKKVDCFVHGKTFEETMNDGDIEPRLL
jgi:hypothetical protein